MNHKRHVHSPLPCAVCGRDVSPVERMPAELIRTSVRELIAADHPEFGPGAVICLPDLNRYRSHWIEKVLSEERGEISAIEQQVLKSLRDQETLTRNTNLQVDAQFTVGERIADRIAAFGGSWKFILTFLGIITVWMILNSTQLLLKPFDRYPFILLNLALSCLAALQAPVIMMSQHRQEDRDRVRAENDYRTNLKAELEVRNLNTKIDQMLGHQWAHLMEIQQMQMELLEELGHRLPDPKA